MSVDGGSDCVVLRLDTSTISIKYTKVLPVCYALGFCLQYTAQSTTTSADPCQYLFRRFIIDSSKVEFLSEHSPERFFA